MQVEMEICQAGFLVCNTILQRWFPVTKLLLHPTLAVLAPRMFRAIENPVVRAASGAIAAKAMEVIVFPEAKPFSGIICHMSQECGGNPSIIAQHAFAPSAIDSTTPTAVGKYKNCTNQANHICSPIAHNFSWKHPACLPHHGITHRVISSR